MTFRTKQFGNQSVSSIFFAFFVFKNKIFKNYCFDFFKLLLKIVFENIRPCLVSIKFSVFFIQTFRKQEKHV